MSDPRRPDTYLVVNCRGGSRIKYGLYQASQFKGSDLDEQPQTDEQGTPTFRLRQDETWLPPGERRLMPLSQVLELVESNIRRQNPGPKVDKIS